MGADGTKFWEVGADIIWVPYYEDGSNSGELPSFSTTEWAILD